MKTKTNEEEEEQKEDYLSVDIYDDISILPTAWCPLNNENFYTVNIYWKKNYVPTYDVDLLTLQI